MDRQAARSCCTHTPPEATQPCPPPRCTPPGDAVPPVSPQARTSCWGRGVGYARSSGALPWGEQAAPRAGRRPSPLCLGVRLQSRDSPTSRPSCMGGAGCSVRASHLGIALGRAKRDRALSASTGWLPTGLIATGLTSRSQDCSAGPFPAAGRGNGESRAQPALQRAGKSRSGLALKGGTEPRSRWLPSEATD